MDSVEVLCQACGGKRFKEEVYQYRLKGKSIDEVLAMSITEAVEFFEEKAIQRKLKQILAVGLGYMTLGQPLNTLSGGECQRLKLAKELSKKAISTLWMNQQPDCTWQTSRAFWRSSND